MSSSAKKSEGKLKVQRIVGVTKRDLKTKGFAYEPPVTDAEDRFKDNKVSRGKDGKLNLTLTYMEARGKAPARVETLRVYKARIPNPKGGKNKPLLLKGLVKQMKTGRLYLYSKDLGKYVELDETQYNSIVEHVGDKDDVRGTIYNPFKDDSDVAGFYENNPDLAPEAEVSSVPVPKVPAAAMGPSPEAAETGDEFDELDESKVTLLFNPKKGDVVVRYDEEGDVFAIEDPNYEFHTPHIILTYKGGLADYYNDDDAEEEEKILELGNVDYRKLKQTPPIQVKSFTIDGFYDKKSTYGGWEIQMGSTTYGMYNVFYQDKDFQFEYFLDGDRNDIEKNMYDNMSSSGSLGYFLFQGSYFDEDEDAGYNKNKVKFLVDSENNVWLVDSQRMNPYYRYEDLTYGVNWLTRPVGKVGTEDNDPADWDGEFVEWVSPEFMTDGNWEQTKSVEEGLGLQSDGDDYVKMKRKEIKEAEESDEEEEFDVEDVEEFVYKGKLYYIDSDKQVYDAETAEQLDEYLEEDLTQTILNLYDAETAAPAVPVPPKVETVSTATMTDIMEIAIKASVSAASAALVAERQTIETQTEPMEAASVTVPEVIEKIVYRTRQPDNIVTNPNFAEEFYRKEDNDEYFISKGEDFFESNFFDEDDGEYTEYEQFQLEGFGTVGEQAIRQGADKYINYYVERTTGLIYIEPDDWDGQSDLTKIVGIDNLLANVPFNEWRLKMRYELVVSILFTFPKP